MSCPDGCQCDGTAEAPEDEETVAQYRGVLIIEWPAPRVASPYNAMTGSLLNITDAVSGKQITTCTHIAISASAESLVTADLTLLTDGDGEPLFDGKDAEEFRTGVFPFLVGEMRVRKPQEG